MPLRLVKATPEPQGTKGNPDSLDDLYELYAPDVKRWAARLSGPRADVEDLIHDVFVIALRRRFTFRGDAHVRTWLFRITNRRRGLDGRSAELGSAMGDRGQLCVLSKVACDWGMRST